MRHRPATPATPATLLPAGLLLVILGLLGCLTACGASPAGPTARPARSVAPPTGPTVSPPAAGVGRGPVAVLHGWDARRLAAWRSADPGALRRLYTPGSASGAADVRLLREYAEHGLVVQDLRTQVFSVRVLLSTSTRLRLRVTDRVAGGTARRAGRLVALPASPPAVRLVDLRRAGTGGWRVAETTRPG